MDCSRRVHYPIFLALAMLWLSIEARSQDLFEIQVYPYETVPPRYTMFELHMNTFPSGTNDTSDGTYANDDQFHLTLEVTHGLTQHWELGAYLVTAYVPDVGMRIAGTRVRPRYRFSEGLRFPFKLSISTELGFTRHEFDPNTITLEIRPILERELGRWYFSINPDFTKSLSGPDAHRGFGMEPAAKGSYRIHKLIEAGLEYYAETGPIAHFDSAHEQHHLIFPTLDLNVSPNWELNFGVGRGLTGTSEHWVIKWIIGRRLKF